MYLSKDEAGDVYTVTLMHYPHEFDLLLLNPDILLDEAVKQAIASKANNELKSVQKGTFLNFPSADFLIQNKESIIHGKTFFSNKILFVLIAINHSMVDSARASKQFLDSFQMLQ